MSFMRDAIFKPLPLVWGAGSGLIGTASYFGVDESVSIALRLAIAISIFLASSLAGMMVVAYEFHRRAKTPVSVRTVIEGTHYYQGKIIIILDKSNWIETGQLLVLIAIADGVQLPLALLSVETTTTEGHPQCVVVVPLTDKRLEDYLSDRSRWRSLSALSEIKSRYLEV